MTKLIQRFNGLFAASTVAGFVRNRRCEEAGFVSNRMHLKAPSAAAGFSRNQLPCFWAIVLLSFCVNVNAQDQPAKQPAPSTSSELVEGLLDLINEPATKNAGEAPAKQPLTPADVGLGGEDLGEASENPLLAVRQSMLIAAGYLRRDGANAETMKLQSDIVRRLDDLISQLEKSQSKEDKSKQESQQQAELSNAQKQREQQNRSQAMKSRPGERKNSENGDDRAERQGEPENPPTQRGNGGSAKAELADAKSLQQDVWGQLPSRVRQQMQSRMVEQFLPAYKEQIEAYFQALLK